MAADRPLKLTRREFVATGAAALVGLAAKSEQRIEGGFVNDSFAMGHRLRDRAQFPAPRRTERVPVVIVGGGIAGLCAAWRFWKRGFSDYVLLEMEKQPGGNARWGENEISAYPWAAHYLPVPGKNGKLVRELCEDLGLLKDGEWEERHLCFSPQERLFLHGRWQDGLEPIVGTKKADLEEFKRFEEQIKEFRASGEFKLPNAEGARKRADLDRISIAQWMHDQGYKSNYLQWYVDYGCRDDYGANARETSAWAGLHYHAARESEEKGPLTWPEGNGWIVKKMMEWVGERVRSGAPVHRIESRGRQMRVLAGEIEYLANTVIFAAPTFLAPYIVEGAPPVHGFEYSPWLTANLTLDRLPMVRGGSAPAWDNVVYDSPTLGYVVATHQSLATQEERSVWTFYWALAQGPAAMNRNLLLEKSWSYWKDAILFDLSRPHPDIAECVSRIDIMRLGHAMIRPTVGFMFSPERERWGKLDGRVLYANSDLSGLSLFEEAQYRGVRAADRAMKLVGKA